MAGTPSSTGRAVVIGASVAGLLAARVLADHVEQVVVVERDVLPAGAEHRRGVPQDRLLHVLLARGRAVADDLLPGFSAELEAAGGVPVRVPRDQLLLGSAGWMDRRPVAWEVVSSTRPLMEAVLRRRVLELPGVTVLQGSEAAALTTSPDARSVTGVTVRRVDDGGTTDLAADLVVDAAGRGSRAPAWLAELGYPAPVLEQVDPKVAYAARLFRIPDGFDADWTAVMLTAGPPTNPRTGYLFPVEDGQWIVSLMGAAGEHPPTDEEGWWAFVRRLRSPVIAEAVTGAEPTSPIRGHRGTANRRWRFDRMPRWPEGFVVVGDAVAAFNPVYGQGMSVAGMAAEALDACLRAHRATHHPGDLGDGLAARFQRAQARADAAAWMISTGEDLRFPTTTGMPVTRVLRAQHRYLDRVAAAATTDPTVTTAYARVLGMLDPPTALFRPRVLAAVLRAGGGAGVDAPPPPRPPEQTPVGAGVGRGVQ
ncbi:NAD(P)/FAD-dependent oxidoreductase [Modestobacter sp. I12A-02662]|uniref:NAD(P)/FAD-dependent oxidoreductase n=1 Tax=Modestobacter sp. I12A-02662 TaxID=1730496 RepID=UPI0034DE563C